MDNIKKVELDKLNINNNVKLNTMQADANTSAVENLQLCNFIDDIKNFPAYLSLTKEQKEYVKNIKGEVKDIIKSEDGSAIIKIGKTGKVKIRKDGTLEARWHEPVEVKSYDNVHDGRVRRGEPYKIHEEYYSDGTIKSRYEEYQDATVDIKYNSYGKQTENILRRDNGTMIKTVTDYSGDKMYLRTTTESINGVVKEETKFKYDDSEYCIYESTIKNGILTFEYNKYFDNYYNQYVEENHFYGAGIEKKIGSEYYDENGRSISEIEYKRRINNIYNSSSNY